MHCLARLIDANANRAREAMRVMEDIARFVLDDADLCSRFKHLRHDFAEALSRLPAGRIEAARNTPDDVGTAIATERERARGSLHDIAVASGKRLSEALRCIEEAAKTFDPILADRIEHARYCGYDLEQHLVPRLATSRRRQWRICVLLTEALCHRPWRDALAAAIDGGADCIQVREKEMKGGDLARRVEDIVQVARPAQVSVIVNDRVDVALACEADGVHLGSNDLSLAAARRLAGNTLLLGASTHTLDEADLAEKAGADYCGVGMMFSSDLKPQLSCSGPTYLRQFIARHPDVPHLAIGGITPDNISVLIEAGARGVAVSRAVCAAEHPDRVVSALRTALDAAGTDADTEHLPHSVSDRG